MENLPFIPEEIPEVPKPENMDGKLMDSMSKLAELKKKAEEELKNAGIKLTENKPEDYQAEILELSKKIEDLEIHGYSAKTEKERLNSLNEKVKEGELVKV